MAPPRLARSPGGAVSQSFETGSRGLSALLCAARGAVVEFLAFPFARMPPTGNTARNTRARAGMAQSDASSFVTSPRYRRCQPRSLARPRAATLCAAHVPTSAQNRCAHRSVSIGLWSDCQHNGAYRTIVLGLPARQPSKTTPRLPAVCSRCNALAGARPFTLSLSVP